MPSRRDLRIMTALGVLAVGLALAQTVAGLDAGLLHLAPMLVLLLPLLAGRYVGEEQIAALVAWIARAPRAVATLKPRVSRVARDGFRGGQLVAASLGERGPPVRAALLRA